MNISELLEQGVNLMLLGMGMVFFILGLLVVVIKGVSALILKYEPAAEQQVSPSGSNRINDDIVAAITIAVERFRSK
ncbi:MAG: OadG family transporter subunit [Methylococcales bacterium]|jgi:oxaloacetate decarboxylase gamma subunit